MSFLKLLDLSGEEMLAVAYWMQEGAEQIIKEFSRVYSGNEGAANAAFYTARDIFEEIRLKLGDFA